MDESGIDWLHLVLGLVGGLAVFLLGMEELTSSLRAFAGRKLKNLIQSATKNRFYSVASGTLVTAAVQSSSITTVLLVGFGSAGLLSLTHSAGVILGANLGSTVTAQIIAFNVTQWGLGLIAFGFVMRLWRSREHIRYFGGFLLGLGLIFFGMDLMSDSTLPLRDYQPFVDLMGSMDSPLFGILCGLVFTAIIQSSAATTGLTIILATEGFLNLEGAVAIAMGANVGTCVTALLAAVGQPREALRVALMHIIFNVAGVLIWFPIIPVLCEIAIWMTGIFDAGGGAMDVGRAVANAHTAFNFLNALIFVGLIRFLVSFVEKIVPQPDKRQALNPFLDDYYLKDPEVALDQVRLEAVEFLRSVSGSYRDLSGAIFRKDKAAVSDFAGADDQIDARQEDFLRFLGRLAERRLTGHQQKELNSFIGIVNHVENLGDLLDHVFQGLGLRLIQMESGMSDETGRLFSELTSEVEQVFDAAIVAVEKFSEESAKDVFSSESKVRETSRKAKDSLASRLSNRNEERLRIFRIEIDLIECQSRVAHLLSEMIREIRR